MRWKEEAMDKLKRYSAMERALENIPEELLRLQKDAVALRSPAGNGISVKGGGGRREDAMINNLVQRQELEWNLEQARRWITIIDRGLAALNPEERLVLQRLYLRPERGAVDRLCGELGVEQASVYRKRDKALHRFTVALYGFTET